MVFRKPKKKIRYVIYEQKTDPMGNDHIYTQIQNTRNGHQFKATYIIQYKNIEIYNLRYTPYYKEVLLLMKELTFGRARVAQ
jgi:hypothetical protein